ncbi:MAG: hypothetical protein CMD33_04490 [Flavobacteriales bacterium]|nr:hypothetical protein [Flavobacteriales bacterium]
MFVMGCSMQKRMLMPGWHVERNTQPRAFELDNTMVASLDDAAVEKEGRSLVLNPFESSHRPERVETTRSPDLEALEISSPPPIRQTRVATDLAKMQGLDATIQLDRNAELTLTLVGAALLMWGYIPFSIIGFLVVFLASIVGAPLVHALIWGEKMEWSKSRLVRIALSLVLSGLVLTGVVALVADILGLIF